MKFSKLSQLFLVSAIGLILATLLTACQLVTVDFVFVACSAGAAAGSSGQILTYAVDSQSGALRTASPAISSGGTGPIALATTSDYYNLYVANQGNSSVVHFAIDLHGNLFKKDNRHPRLHPRVDCRELREYLLIRGIWHQLRHAH